jgi:CRISPR-associated endonuclease/helicase Cas3
MPDVGALFSKIQRYEIYDRRKAGAWGYVEAAQLAVSETRKAGSCLVIVNTKADQMSACVAC